jgi:hypothetical protein
MEQNPKERFEAIKKILINVVLNHLFKMKQFIR